MAPKTQTMDKGTNTEDSEEYLEIKKLTEQNFKLMSTLEEEREKFRSFLGGICRNLASQQQSLSESLRIFQENIREQGKILSSKADIFKSITLRNDFPERSNRWAPNGCHEDRNETPVLRATSPFRLPQRCQHARVAQIQPIRRGVDVDLQFLDHLKRKHS